MWQSKQRIVSLPQTIMRESKDRFLKRTVGCQNTSLKGRLGTNVKTILWNGNKRHRNGIQVGRGQHQCSVTCIALNVTSVDRVSHMHIVLMSLGILMTFVIRCTND